MRAHRTGTSPTATDRGLALPSRSGSTAKVRLPWLPLLTFALLLAASAAFAAPTVYTAQELVRIGPSDAVPASASTTMNLYAAKGEYESFQIIVNAQSGGLTNVSVTAPDLGGPRITLYRESYVYLPSGSADYSSNRNHPHGAGWYPDGLIPFANPDTGLPLTGGTLTATPFSVAAGQNQPIWVDIFVPRTQAAGTYTGTFTITSNQGSASVVLSLKVWNFTLPVTPFEQSSFLIWNNPQSLQWEKELLHNRIMPESDNISYEKTLMAEDGLSCTTMPFWSAANVATGTISPAPSVQQFQQAAAAHQPGIMKYDYMADEIGWYTPFYPTIKQWAYNMHQAGVNNLITMMPDPALYDDGSGTGRSAVDIWVVLPKQYDQVPDRIKYVIAKGDQVWSYNCNTQDDYSPKWQIDFDPINYRIQPGFINASLGLTGLLYWRVDFWSSDPWNNVLPYPPFPGEGMLVYPGDQVGLPGYVVPSVRLKYLRDGMDDYDYVQLLKQAGQGDWALQVARTVGPDWTNWTRNPNALEAARKQLGDKLDSLAGGGGATHAVTVTASASPTVVASGGTTMLMASAADSLGDSIASWSWSDGGAGGTFSPSTAVPNPTYTAPANAGSGTVSVMLTATATCGGAAPVSGTATVTLAVQPAFPTPAHTLTTTASASPASVASGGTTALLASATDSLGDSIASWSWSDGGAGGTFLPSTSAQNPIYTAASNTTGGPQTVTLVVTATCSGAAPVSGIATTTLTVEPAAAPSGAAHALAVTASVSPATVASGGIANPTAAAGDSLGHTIASWSWSDGNAGGTFLPSAAVQNPIYIAPANTVSGSHIITLTVTATCLSATPVSGSASTSLIVPLATSLVVPPSPPSVPAPHIVQVTLSATPTPVDAGGKVTLQASAADTLGDGIASWAWSDGGAGGTFRPSANVQNPIYTAPIRQATTPFPVTLTVTATCSGSIPVSGSAAATLTVSGAGAPIMVFGDILPGYWAYSAIKAAYNAGIVAGYPDGTYRPSRLITRDQIAVYLARALAGGDSNIPAGPSTATFTDVPTTYWAFRAIEYVVQLGIMQGYADGTFDPTAQVKRDQMAVCLARAMVNPTGEAGLASYQPPATPTFKDVGPDYWAYRHIEYVAAAGVVAGYGDGTYRPTNPVSRDQLAVYVTRAFKLP